MITSCTLSPYVLKGAFKISSEVKPLSVVQMNVKLDTRMLEKNTHSAFSNDGPEIDDSVDTSVDACTDYQKTSNRGGLEFCHEHLFDIVI